MKISELAKAADTSKDTVRHYVELGLLKPNRNPENGYQVFDEVALNRLNFIKAARGLGFSLQNVQQVFADAKNTKSPCPRVRKLMEQRIIETRQHITELQALCERMENAMSEWESMPDCVPTGSTVCKLIESQWHESGNKTSTLKNGKRNKNQIKSGARV